MSVPTIRTARLVLRPLAAGDAPAIVDGIDDWDVARWLVSVPSPYTAEDAARFLAAVAPGGELDRLGDRVWGIEEGGGLVGVVSLTEELGYWLRRDSWGRGLAPEAARAVIDHHFADPAAPDLVSGSFDGNERSARVLRRLGFRPDGTRTRGCLARGEDVTSHQVRLTRADWQARHQAPREAPTHRAAP